MQGIVEGFEKAPISDEDKALLRFAKKLTLQPQNMLREDCENLRGLGFDDRAITDAVQVASYFAYINRVADALGVDPEHDMTEDGRLESSS